MSKVRFLALAGVLLAALVIPRAPVGAVAAPSVTLTPVGSPFSAATLSRLWGAPGTSESFAAAAVGDVTGDGQPDVVVGSTDGYIRIWSKTGALEVAQYTGDGAVQASPLLADVTGDGVADVVTGNTAGPVMAFSAIGGNVQFAFWRYDCDPISGKLCAMFGTPSVADIDGDGSPEIVVAKWDHMLYAYHLNGSLAAGFPLRLWDTIWSSPVVADVNGDGAPEIIVGGDCDGVEGQPCYGNGHGGYVWAISGRGQVLWAYYVQGQVVWSTPAIADVNGDGKRDIVVGTGLNFPAPAGNDVFALDGNAGAVIWHARTLGRAMGSPAIGDIDGDGRPETVILSEGGQISVIRSDGSIKYAVCVDDPQDGVCRDATKGTHGSAVLADVNNDGRVDIVVMAEHWMDVLDGPTGAFEAKVVAPVRNPSGISAPASAPTVAQVDGQTWIVQTATYDANGDIARDAGDQVVTLVWRTGTALGQAPWPTFKQNMSRSGTVIDSTPPTLTLPSLANQPTTGVDVAWTAADNQGGSGLAGVSIELLDPANKWVPFVTNIPGPAGHYPLYGLAGHAYQLRGRARDAAGNWSGYVTATVGIAAGATRVQPFKSLYTVSTQGEISSYLTVPTTGPTWSWSAVRGLAAAPNGAGGYVVDLFGGITAFGGAPALSGSWYQPGWDIARGIALNPDGQGGYVLDGWGGLHPFGNAAAAVPGAPWWNGWDIARAVVMAPTSTAANPAGYLLDGWGGVHAFGSAPPLPQNGYWPGWDIAHAMTLNPDGQGGYVLDGWGGLHPFGNARFVSNSPYWRGWDIARGVVSYGNGANAAGYVLDGFGGLNPFGTATAGPPVPKYWGRDLARGIALAP